MGPHTPSEGTHNGSHMHTTVQTPRQPHNSHRDSSHNNTATHTLRVTPVMTATQSQPQESHTSTTQTIHHTGIPRATQSQLHNHTLTQNDKHTITVTLTTCRLASPARGPHLHAPLPEAGSQAPAHCLPSPSLRRTHKGPDPQEPNPGRTIQTEGR